MEYVVDGNPVSTRADWRHTLIPAMPQTARASAFPGIGERFVIRDVPMPGGVMVIGYLEGSGASDGAAMTALHDQLKAWGIKRSTKTLHSVRVHLTTLPEAYVDAFDIIGPVIAFDPGNLASGHVAVQQLVRWVWIETK